jgi:hypothetical protein
MQWPIQVPIPLPNWFMCLFKLSLFIIYHILFNVQIVSNPFQNHKNWKLKMTSYISGVSKVDNCLVIYHQWFKVQLCSWLNNLIKVSKLWAKKNIKLLFIGVGSWDQTIFFLLPQSVYLCWSFFCSRKKKVNDSTHGPTYLKHFFNPRKPFNPRYQ